MLGNRGLRWLRVGRGLLLCLCLACRQEARDGPAQESAPTEPEPARELLVFPSDLRVDETSVNEFVERAMGECASGDYERFRRLWSVREDPLSREEYESGWQAVRQIKLRALEPVMLTGEAAWAQARGSGGEKVYVILADVELDPAHRAARDEPHREVVLVIRREQDAWRLSRAPKALREWLKERLELKAGPGL